MLFRSVPSDGSESALEAATYAAGLARQFGAEVTLLHVVEVPRLPLGLGGFSLKDSETVRQDLFDVGHAILAMTQKPFAQAGIPIETELREGRAADAIVEVATQGHHDLIVIGSRGVSSTAHLFLGSVSEKVARRAPCPVLIVRRGTADTAW